MQPEMRWALPVLGMWMAACGSAPHRAPAPANPAMPPGSPPASSADATPDAWLATCAAVTTCGACLNSPPCSWCAGEARCLSPRASCSEERVSESAACTTAPLTLAKKRHPELAARLATYASVRESKTFALAAFRQERFFVTAGDCFAVLSDVPDAGSAGLDLSYAVQQIGTPDPARKRPSFVPSTATRGAFGELSGELCPWEPTYLVVTWLTPSARSGELRLQLLTRRNPSPVAPPPAAPGGGGSGFQGGSCSDYECGEDCRSEHRACKLDCFRYGRHEMGSQRLCEAGCNQAQRSCERGCSVPCPR